MARPPVLILALTFLWAGCHSLPISFAPPQQRPALPTGNFVLMSDPTADSYIVQGFRAHSETTWRWAYDHPVLRFSLPETGALKFEMDFTLPDATFHQTGPVTLAISVNGRPLDRPRYDHPGDYHYQHEVPEAMLRANGENRVAIDVNKSATPEHLGFVLTRAGFSE